MKTKTLYNCIKRQKHNINAIRRFDLDSVKPGANEKWISDNKIKLLYMCRENVKTLRSIGRLPSENGRIRIIDTCRYLVEKYAYSLDEEKLTAELRSMQTDGEYFTIKELHYLKTILASVAFDAIEGDLCGKTENVSGLAVKMLYELENIDFQSIYERVSRVEALLLSDPSGIYGHCDHATKSLYRMKLSRTAEKLKIDELELAKRCLESAENSEGKRSHIGYCIIKNAERDRGRLYFLALDALPMLVVLPITAIAYIQTSVTAFVASALAYFPLRRLLKLMIDDLLSRCAPTEITPRLDLKHIPSDAKTLLTYTVSLSGKTNDAHLFDKLLTYARAYNKENLSFSVLADLPDSDAETDARDAEILEYAENRIDEIRSFNPSCTLFYRKRTYSRSERKFIGNERKRGAQEELVSLLTGEPSTLVAYGNRDLSEVRYILALDADTEIMQADLMRLIATAAHPCNAPEYGIAGGAERVTDGYGVFVPTAVTSLKNASKRNKYTIYKTAFEGRGSYGNAVFQTHGALTGEGVYCGKGLIDVNAYKRVISGRFPKEKILSHDIAEGAFLRAAPVTDAVIYDTPPSSLISERKRLHRWVRGDVQSLCLTRRYIADESGERCKNPLSARARALIADPVKEQLASAVRVPAVMLALLSGGALGLTVYAIAVSDHIYESLWRIVGMIRVPRRKYASQAPDYRRAACFQSAVKLMSAADLTCLSIDAIARAYYRMNVSHRRLLEWTASSVADSQKNEKLAHVKALKTSVVLGALSITFGLFVRNLSSVFFFLDGISWVMYPFAAEYFNTSYRETPVKRRKDDIRADAVKMWQFFAENVTEEYGFLPPDNVSYFPKKKTAERTSPTNIGLYLLSVLNAFDFGIIGSDELWRRLTDTLSSVTALERYRGHLYNWYDIRTKRALPPFYISTVDSGNFAISLLTVKNGIKRLGPLFAEPIRLIDQLISEMDFSFLYSEKRDLFRIGYDVTHGRFDPNFYDLYPSEMLATSFYAAAKGQISAENFAALGRIFSDKDDSLPAMLSWSGTAFEYFMPSIWLPTDPMTERGEMLLSAAEKQKNASKIFENARIYGMSESAYYDFDEEMNYSYKANGVPSLAISHDASADAVFAPYSLYLMMNTDEDAASALTELKSTSLYGRYGFYDALDMTPLRVGKEAAVIRQYMAHHIGMSIAAAANYCFDDINVKRFTDDPDIAAAEHLLFTKNEICRPRADDELHRAQANLPPRSVKNGEIARQGTVVISNGLIKISADETGNVAFYSGETLLTRQKDGDVKGFGILIRADGEIYDCLGGGSAGVKQTFSCDGASVAYENEIIHGEGVIGTQVILTVDPETASAAILLSVTGKIDSLEALFYAFPVLAKERDYKSAPAYSDLFLTVKTDADSAAFARRMRDGGEDEMHFDFASVPDKIITDVSGIAVFPLDADFAERIFDAREGCGAFAAVNPFVSAVFSRRDAGESFEMRIVHGQRQDAGERFPELLRGSEKRFRLFSAYAGADESAVGAAMRLYTMISETDRKITVCAKKDAALRYRRDILWRFGISGDLPIVLCFPDDVRSSSSEYALEEILRAKRFLFVSGVRFDLVIVADDEGYMNGDVKTIGALIEKNGLSRLLSKNNGVFVIGKSALSENDLSIITAVSSGIVGAHDADLTSAFPAKSTEKLVRTPVRFARREIGFLSDGVRITDGALPTPWCGMYANSVFGTLLTHKTAGFSWFRNSSLGTISRRHTDALTGSAGEKLTVTTENGVFDLLLCSDEVSYLSDAALYRGTADGISYEVRIGVDAKLPVKLYHVRFDPETAKDGAFLSLSLYPDCKCVFRDDALSLFKDVPSTVTVFSVPSQCRRSTDVFSDRITVTSCLNDASAGFVIAAYPSSSPSSAIEFAKYKYSSTDAILSGMREYADKLKDLLLSEYSGREKALSDMLGASVRQAYLYRMTARTGYYQSGGAYGYRDQLQDSLAALYFAPDLTKRQILRACRRQYTDGRVQHWWHTGVGGLRSRCSDDYMWLPYVTSEYVLSTGDVEILSLTVPYLSSPPLADGEEDRYESPPHTPERFTVLDHCLRAIDASYDRGEHGLPLMLSGDWNDGMNGIGARGRGESVWLAFFFALTYKRFAELLRICRMEEDADGLISEASRLIFAAEDAWDGSWYRRAYDDDGVPVGSAESTECRIDVIPQAFSVFAGADRERSVIAMESVMRELYDSERGILRLFAPSFKNKTEYGYITRYPEGIRENGGQYTHAAVWAARAFFELGAYRRGKELLFAISPSVIYENGAMSGRYNAEPYLICADVYYGEGITGKSGWSGYTGSAAWYYTTAMKYIFGVEFAGGELILNVRPEYVAGDFTLRFSYNGHSVTVCASYSGKVPDLDFDLVISAVPKEAVKTGKITKDIKILLKIRN